HERAVDARIDIHLGKNILADSVFHEDGVEAEALHANQAITLLAGQLHESWQARAGVDSEIVYEACLKIFRIRNRHRPIGSPDALDFGDDHAWADHLERVPDPVIDAVQVDRKQVNGSFESIVPDEIVNVLACDPGTDKLGRVGERVSELGIE